MWITRRCLSFRVYFTCCPRMSTTASWVAEAIDALSLGEWVRRLGGRERSDVLNRVADAFLARPGVLFWWEHLKVPAEYWHTEQGYQHLPRIAPDPEAACWLITGLTDADEEKAVFECTPALASALVGECPHFEYAVVDPALTWIVIENHHDVLIATGDAGKRLSRMRE
jgi:hypothetical protein